MNAKCGRHLWRSNDPEDACPSCIDEALYGHPEELREGDHAGLSPRQAIERMTDEELVKLAFAFALIDAGPSGVSVRAPKFRAALLRALEP